MYHTSTNITSKYRQETHYNYVKNSGFWPSSFAGKTCSPLLCYRKANRTNSCGNAIANSQGLLHAETGFSYFGAGKISQNILLIALLCIGLNANAKIDMNNKIVLCNASNVVLCNEVCEKDSVSSFFNRFCADSNFQYSRVIFPVKCTVKMDAYDEPDIEEIIEKKNWKYTNFLNLQTNRLIEIERVNKTTFKLNLQIEDTGVYVDYLFELIDCKWYLVKIINAST